MATSQARARARAQLDRRLSQLQPTAQWASPRQGWIRTIRNALGMSAHDLGRRLGVSDAAIRQLEVSETSGTIKLNSLQRAAKAMDCDLVVVMVPRTSLTDMVQARADEVLSGVESRVAQTMALEDQSAAALPSSQRVRREALIDSGRLWRDG